MTDTTALYFGCWKDVGHSYYAPGMSSANYKTRSSELTPWGDGIDGRFTPKSTSKQGSALLTHDQGWTVLSIHDYTVDRRRNSHSTFAFVGTLDYDEAVAAATEHFSEVMRRLGSIERVEM